MKILLIDDDLTSLEVLRDVFILNDFECVAFNNPALGLKAYQDDKFDVTLLDFLMPEFNGIEILKSIKEINPEARVIVYSACEDDDIIAEALKNGAQAYFTKPISWKDIEQVLEEIIKVNSGL